MKKINFKMVTIFILVLTDYVFTFLSISLGFVSEGNLLMCWLFEGDFLNGLLIKGLYTGILLFLVDVLSKSDKVTKVSFYFLNFCLSCYALVNILHISLFYDYLKGV